MLLEELIPETTYGYWITSEGEILPVPNEAHTRIIRKYLNPGMGWATDNDLAAKHGWIRIVHKPPYSELNVDYINPTPAARRSLIRLVKDFRDDLDHVFISIAKDPKQTFHPGHWKHTEFEGPRAGGQALLFLNQKT